MNKRDILCKQIVAIEIRVVIRFVELRTHTHTLIYKKLNLNGTVTMKMDTKAINYCYCGRKSNCLCFVLKRATDGAQKRLGQKRSEKKGNRR